MDTQEKTNKICDVQLAAMRALLGHVTSNIQSISISVEDHKIHLYFLFNGEIGMNDRDNAENVRQKMRAEFPSDDIVLHCIQVETVELPLSLPGRRFAVFIRNFMRQPN